LSFFWRSASFILTVDFAGISILEIPCFVLRLNGDTHSSVTIASALPLVATHAA
jgi:hypothetical protein